MEIPGIMQTYQFLQENSDGKHRQSEQKSVSVYFSFI